MAGLISWSGSFGGRGSNYANLFSGLNLADGSYDPSSASAWASFPGTFLGAAAPDTGDGTPVIATFGSGGFLCQHTWLELGLQLRHSLSTTAQPWLYVQMLEIYTSAHMVWPPSLLLHPASQSDCQQAPKAAWSDVPPAPVKNGSS